MIVLDMLHFRLTGSDMVPLQNSAVFWKKDLTLEITGGDNERSDESESGDSGGSNDEFDRNNEGTALKSDGISVAYNKREMYFSNREMIARQMDKSLPHVVCKVESSKATSCVWCCRKKHDGNNMTGKKHSRHGRTTKFHCPVCMVSLCRVRRFDGRSCFELFHSSTSLIDYCRTEMDDVVHVATTSDKR